MKSKKGAKAKRKAKVADEADVKLSQAVFKNHSQRTHTLIACFLTGTPALKWDPDIAAEYGNLHIVQVLRSHNIHCTDKGADFAVLDGHLHIVQDLRKYNIHCTNEAAQYAAENGYLDILRDLRKHGIHCTSSYGADIAAQNGYLEIIQDLREHDIHCTSEGMELAVVFGHLEVVHDLRTHGIECSESDMTSAATFGHLDILKDLHVHCGHRYLPMHITCAARYGHLHVIKFLYNELNINYRSNYLWNVEWANGRGRGHIRDFIGDYMTAENEKSATRILERAQAAARKWSFK